MVSECLEGIKVRKYQILYVGTEFALFIDVTVLKRVMKKFGKGGYIVAQKMMVIAAHMGDFIWRCGGAIAKYADMGWDVRVIVLSYGSRGEAKNYWSNPGGNLEECNQRRREEGMRAAEILGVSSIEFYEFEDYPLMMDKGRLEKLATEIRRFRPDFIVTHDREDDIFNPDHNLTRRSVMAAYQIASGAGYRDGFDTAPRQTPIFGFEPHNTEICHFMPQIYIDISDVMERKIAAMEGCQTQKGMCAQYINKAETRAAQCNGRGNKTCTYAEAFSRFGPIAKHGYFVW